MPSSGQTLCIPLRSGAVGLCRNASGFPFMIYGIVRDMNPGGEELSQESYQEAEP